MQNDDPIVITGAMRTPLGGFQGELSSQNASNWAVSPLVLLFHTAQ